jgi:hypothetical protein
MANTKNIKQLITFYKKIYSLTPSERSDYIGKLSRKKLKRLYELFKNLLSSKLPCETGVIARIRKFAPIIRHIVNTAHSDVKKIRFLKSIQGGYLLNILLPLAIKVLTSIIE